MKIFLTLFFALITIGIILSRIRMRNHLVYKSYKRNLKREKLEKVLSEIQMFLFYQKPRIYIRTYLLMIPLFALFYSLMPDDFYYETNEQYLDNLANDISFEINKCLDDYTYHEDLIEQFFVPDKPIEYKNNNFYFRFKSVMHFCLDDYEYLKPHKGIVINNCRAEIGSKIDGYLNSHFLDFNRIYNDSVSYISIAECHVPPITLVIKPGEYNGSWYSEFENDSLYSSNLLNESCFLLNDSFMKLLKSIAEEFIPYKRYCYKSKSSSSEEKFKYSTKYIQDSLRILNPHVDLTYRIQNKLNLYKETTESGFPTSVWDNYLRMIYCSSATITPLNCNIVPVTNNAIILITLETILGIILIVLFIKAVLKKE